MPRRYPFSLNSPTFKVPTSVTAWSITAFVPSPTIFTVRNSLIFGTAPKQHIDWSRISNNSVTFPSFTLSGSMNPLIATFRPSYALIVAGIWFVSLVGNKGLRLDGLTLFFALGTSVFVAAYTVVDGIGGRVSGQPSAYAGLVFVFDAIFLSVTALGLRGPGIIREVAPFWKSGTIGALLSVGAYWIAIWAMSQAPIASVAALRETSILVVMLLSMRFLKETVTAARLSGALLIVAGAVLIRLS